MSTREKLFNMLERLTDEELEGLYQFLKNLIPLEDEDDVFCEELYRAYEQDDGPEKHETVTLEELAKELGQDIA